MPNPDRIRGATALLEVIGVPAGRGGKGPAGRDAALQPPSGRECDEADFRYLLAVEQVRADRSNRPLRLLFATVEASPGNAAPIPRGSVSRLFKALKSELRETDVMGWYQQGRVVAAVLSPTGDGGDTGLSDAIEDRVGHGLRRHLPSRVARSLKVRVIEVTPGAAIDEQEVGT